MATRKPLIGITCDVEDINPPYAGVVRHRARLGTTYMDAVVKAGGVPVMLAPDVALVDEYVARCDGFVFSGGDDIDPTPFGGKLHPKAKAMHPLRQAFEHALLKALDNHAAKPVLGVCLGMQWLGVHRGGHQALIQHLPEVLGEAAAAGHVKDHHHPIEATGEWGRSALKELQPVGCTVASSHNQAILEAALANGGLRVLARSAEGVIEAVDDPSRPFYVGVQWHPERTKGGGLGVEVFRELVRAATGA